MSRQVVSFQLLFFLPLFFFSLSPLFSRADSSVREFDQGVSLYSQEEYESARQIFLRLKENYPNRSLYLVWIGKTYYRQGLPKKALVYFRQALRANPADKITQKLIQEAETQVKNSERPLDVNFKIFLEEPNWINLLKLKREIKKLPDDAQFQFYRNLERKFPKFQIIEEWILALYGDTATGEVISNYFADKSRQNPGLLSMIYEAALPQKKTEDASRDYKDLLERIYDKVDEDKKPEVSGYLGNLELIRTLDASVDYPRIEELLKKTEVRYLKKESYHRLLEASEKSEFLPSLNHLIFRYELEQNKPLSLLIFSKAHPDKINEIKNFLDSSDSLPFAFRILGEVFEKGNLEKIAFKTQASNDFEKALLNYLKGNPEECLSEIVEHKPYFKNREAEILWFLCSENQVSDEVFIKRYAKINKNSENWILTKVMLTWALRKENPALTEVLIRPWLNSAYVEDKIALPYARANFQLKNCKASFGYFKKYFDEFDNKDDFYAYAFCAENQGYIKTAIRNYENFLTHRPYHLYASYYLSKLLAEEEPKKAYDLILKVAFLTQDRWNLEKLIRKVEKNGNIDVFAYDAFTAYLRNDFGRVRHLLEDKFPTLSEDLRFILYKSLESLEDSDRLEELMGKTPLAASTRALVFDNLISKDILKAEVQLTDYRDVFNGFAFSADLAEKFLRAAKPKINNENLKLLINSSRFMSANQLYLLSNFLLRNGFQKEALEYLTYLHMTFPENKKIMKKYRSLKR